ncbi:MAG: SsrA-binding protein SmpB [Planctomycetes bacterium]|jgi:SsrA-binding protein|nr:SsrA-binding protein SmpB [Planctomycetota bacterium]
MSESKDERRMVAENRKARHDFDLLETLECGIALQGTEVKSLRQGKASIAESYAMVRRGELWLLGAHIPEYAFGNIHNHAPLRDRKLLVNKREIAKWERAVKEQGVTIVPLSLYFKGALVKVALALARGRKLHDKREREREKTDRREIERAASRRR